MTAAVLQELGHYDPSETPPSGVPGLSRYFLHSGPNGSPAQPSQVLAACYSRLLANWTDAESEQRFFDFEIHKVTPDYQLVKVASVRLPLAHKSNRPTKFAKINDPDGGSLVDRLFLQEEDAYTKARDADLYESFRAEAQQQGIQGHQLRLLNQLVTTALLRRAGASRTTAERVAVERI